MIDIAENNVSGTETKALLEMEALLEKTQQIEDSMPGLATAYEKFVQDAKAFRRLMGEPSSKRSPSRLAFTTASNRLS